MSKPLCIISCPIDTISGYGKRSVDFVKSLVRIKGEEWDIKILSQRWGNTPFGALDNGTTEEYDLKQRIIPNMDVQPDIWFQITVPNEFQAVGKSFSCGVTAGMETTLCDPSWTEGCNRMDLIMVSSEHAKKTFENSGFTQQDQKGNIIREVRITKPIEVLFEGCDLEKYFKSNDLKDFNLYDDLNTIEESFCFLYFGMWLQGDFGEDRKNVGYTIKAFLETFKNKKNKPALILKTAQGPSSLIDRDRILKKIEDIRKTVTGDLPNIYLIHGELSDDEINCMYNHPKVKAMVCLTKGEGFGRPLLEFSIVGKPIIASGWSGHLDFLQPGLCGLVGGTLTHIHPSALVPNMIIKEAQWFKPDDNQVGYALTDVFNNYKKYQEKAKRLSFKNRQNFSFEKMAEKLDQLLETYVKINKVVPLKLPKLKKI